jgi:double-strand break repair protein MRE11
MVVRYLAGELFTKFALTSQSVLITHRTFNHVNYEDQDINVAIPVFSIHGNHDEPTGHEFYCALDVLQETGLINYFGRVPKNDNIEVKPVLLQKGRTKVAMFGLSNVRDERLFREFRDGHVKFFQPSVQKNEWFNLLVVHQNHHARTVTGYLPENFLPNFMDLIFWGHEHDCILEPTKNADQGFHVIQPGSSIATQMTAGECIDKHVGILTVQGRSFTWDPIRLKTVRPFVFKDLILFDEPSMKNIAKKSNNRAEISRYLKKTIMTMIDEANQKWIDTQGDDLEDADEEDKVPPLPLLRLRVDYTAHGGGNYDMENPQRVANEFIGKVANHEDILLYHIKKKAPRNMKEAIDQPDEAAIAEITLNEIKVEELVAEFLTAQTLTILPQNSFGDSVNQFIGKDDKHAMDHFVKQSLESQIKRLFATVDEEQVDLSSAMEDHRIELEKMFADGHRMKSGTKKLNPKPQHWDDDLDGAWEDQLEAFTIVDDDAAMSVVAESPAASAPATRGRGRGRGGKTVVASTSKTATASKPAAKSSRAKKNPFVQDDDDEESDVQMVLDDDEDEENLFVEPEPTTARRRAASSTTKTSTAKAKPAPKPRATASSRAKTSATATKQSQLDFSQSQAQPKRAAPSRAAAKKQVIEISDDEISDDDAFEPVVSSRGSRKR